LGDKGDYGHGYFLLGFLVGFGKLGWQLTSEQFSLLNKQIASLPHGY